MLARSLTLSCLQLAMRNPFAFPTCFATITAVGFFAWKGTPRSFLLHFASIASSIGLANPIKVKATAIQKGFAILGGEIMDYLNFIAESEHGHLVSFRNGLGLD